MHQLPCRLRMRTPVLGAPTRWRAAHSKRMQACPDDCWAKWQESQGQGPKRTGISWKSHMTRAEPQPHLDEIRKQLLAEILPDAGFEGWNQATLDRAAKALELHPGQVELACPKGAPDLILFWAQKNDEAMLAAWEAEKESLIRIRDKATFLVRARIEAIGEEHREAAARAKTRLALPDMAPEGIRMVWQTADLMWRAMGDTSTDYNYWSKRTIMSGVFTSTFSVWLQGDDEKAWAFLDRRIQNVMQFEKFKFDMKKRSANWPDPVSVLSKLRYGTGRTRPRRM